MLLTHILTLFSELTVLISERSLLASAGELDVAKVQDAGHNHPHALRLFRWEVHQSECVLVWKKSNEWAKVYEKKLEYMYTDYLFMRTHTYTHIYTYTHTHTRTHTHTHTPASPWTQRGRPCCAASQGRCWGSGTGCLPRCCSLLCEKKRIDRC